MELILWRHAEAEDGFPDEERALTPQGIAQADKMAAWLKAHMPQDIKILVSPAKRAQQTAGALHLPFTTVDELAPGASAPPGGGFQRGASRPRIHRGPTGDAGFPSSPRGSWASGGTAGGRGSRVGNFYP